MSYDLYLYPDPDDPFDDADFRTYFQDRPGYLLLDEGTPQAFYENEATGVYFSFVWSEPDEAGDPTEDPAHVLFNINYFRPGFFAEEAVEELAAFIERFVPMVEDPQLEGMGTDGFSREGFLRGWQAGNRLAVQTITKDGHGPAAMLSRDVLQKVWSWNIYRDRLQAAFDAAGQDLFVPRVNVYVVEEDVRTGFVWSDRIPVIIPEGATHVLVGAQEKKGGFLGLGGREEFEIYGAMPVEALKERVEVSPLEVAGKTWLFIPSDMDAPPQKVRSFYDRARKNALPVTSMIPMDQVMEKELFQ